MTIDHVRTSFALPDGLRLLAEVHSARELAQALFIDTLTRRRLAHVREIALRIAPESAAGLTSAAAAPVLFALRDDFGEAVLFAFESGVAHAWFSASSGQAMVAAASATEADRLVDQVSALFDAGRVSDDALPVLFWTAGGRIPRSVRREITAPAWDDVCANYERITAGELAALTAAQPPEGGRLVLWHGAPGTGKTTALRALARAWSDWCATHFVTDPEEFLGSGTGYLLEVLTAKPNRRRRAEPEWKLVVLEDAGELLTVDARERAGQALSRLLNITDGLLGQGTKVIVLVTTNEPLRTLHPAVTRPGRCWRTVEFKPLSAEEASGWLAARDSAATVTQAATLAELYEILRGGEPRTRRPFGFGAWAA
jgi:hypothetical protein